MNTASNLICKGLTRTVVAIGSLCGLVACSQTVEWKEEVKLNDGRTILVTQKRRCEGGDYRATAQATCLSAEAWLTFNLPGSSPEAIVWHSDLDPLILNVDRGSLYIVAFPHYLPAFREHGATNPPYFGFKWDRDHWSAIRFEDIPKEIYDTNLVIEPIPKNKTDHLSLAVKNSSAENGDPRYPSFMRRIDPKFVMKPY